MRARLTRSGDLWVASKAHRQLLEAAQAAHPHECCGLLLGRFGRIETARPARNVHSQPATHFEIDPQALIDAHRAARQGGPSLIGYYHSHPGGEPYPSRTDQEQSAGDGSIWAIIAGTRVMFWEDAPDRFYAHTWKIVGQRRSEGARPSKSELARIHRRQE